MYVPVTTVAVVKQQTSQIQSVSVALVIQHEKLMCRITLSSVASPAVPRVSTQHNSRKSVTEHKIVIRPSAQLLSSYIHHDAIKTVNSSPRQTSLVSDFKET